MEAINVVKPKPEKPYLRSELAERFRGAMKENGLTSTDQLRIPIGFMVKKWYTDDSFHNLPAVRSNLYKELCADNMTWKTFCKGVALFDYDPYDAAEGVYRTISPPRNKPIRAYGETEMRMGAAYSAEPPAKNWRQKVWISIRALFARRRVAVEQVIDRRNPGK